MRERLRKAWESRSPRERRVIIILGVISSAVLYLWLVSAADRARTRLRSSLPQLRVQAEEFEQQAAGYERIKVTPSPPPSSGDLHTLMQTQADVLGLSHALNGIDTLGNDQVQITFTAVPFADWLSWLAGMQQHVRLETARVEALPEPGRVKVIAIFILQGAG
ncbi:general secretion pathway protein M [Nitrosospira multiformis]|uniref:General secretion pathway protein M n=1 Tax=Nitrosospira multiformis TaxID=1231 RepID=A0A2T5IA51_9PROT|nr:type II secretion system protein M [Nitrosospira multiformis]PTQ80687.1 general secretion pathway protein M [Nitrosospira multiformis]